MAAQQGERMPARFEALDFNGFHRSELPRRLAAGNGALAAADSARIGSLAFRLSGGDAYSYLPRADGIEILPGDERAQTVIQLDHESWQGIVHELETPPGLIYAGRVECVRGDPMHFVRWEPRLRAMYNGRPVFDPETARLEARDGSPLDVSQAFELDADLEDMAHFLRTAGYLLAKNVFTREEIATFREHGEQLRRAAQQGDKKSWWGRNAKGEAVLCRVTNAGTLPVFRKLYQDPRVTRLWGLSDEKLTPRTAEGVEGVTVVFKNPDMSEGLSDLPWHRDCGMGGHAVMCPVLILSIYLTPASHQGGELRMLPGSWRGSYGFYEATDAAGPEGVALAAEAGDVSLHYGDVMHAAPPPEGPPPYRESVLLGFAPPGFVHHRGEGSYNDVLLQREDGQVEHLRKAASRT